MSATKQEHGLTISRRRSSEELLTASGPYSRLLLDLVEFGKTRKASDIHIEPNETGLMIRVRVDGMLSTYGQVGIQHRESILLEAKRVFGLSIGTSGRPQDGRVSFPNFRLDMRVSLLPTHFGEKIVARLLDPETGFALENLGLTPKEKAVLEGATKFENGVVIVSGPTGSGKTRTLYSVLNKIDPSIFNIVTLEDPIEYRIEGLNQTQVDKKMGFAAALRAVLRQDPDVILVGEIRDEETARLCFQAAETGHLVFSTLHANGAEQVIDRLQGLGIAPSLLEENLRLSIAQRLEQKLCPACALPIWTVPWIKETTSEGGSLKARNKEGCSQCQSGINGRIPVLEWASFRHDEASSSRQLTVLQSIKEARRARALRGEIDCLEAGYDL